MCQLEALVYFPWERMLNTSFSGVNRPFSASISRGTKLPCWRGRDALGEDKRRKFI